MKNGVFKVCQTYKTFLKNCFLILSGFKFVQTIKDPWLSKNILALSINICLFVSISALADYLCTHIHSWHHFVLTQYAWCYTKIFYVMAGSLSDNNGNQTHNHLIIKGTLNLSAI